MRRIFLSLLGLLALAPKTGNCGVVSFGHNLTATSNILNKKQIALGTPAIAGGVSDKATLGTSSWLFYDYDMYSLFLRYQTMKTKDKTRALQIGYFKTDSASKKYEMEAFWLIWAHGWHFQERYNFYVNFQFHFYTNEIAPFSLRRPRVWKDPTEWSVMTLHEAKLVNGFYLMGEVGFLGLIRKHPIIHTGASLQWRAENWLLQMGFSMTGTGAAFSNPQNRRDYSSIGVSNGRNHGLGDDWSDLLKDDFSIHPELIVSYYF